MKISVVIPAYNAERTIGRAIDSVLAQTRAADEVIVVDDGSTDGTADVVRGYGEKVMLIQQENAGVSVARNQGIEASTGDWIAFLDSDDEWLPEKLQLQSDHLSRHPDLAWTYTSLSWRKRDKSKSQSAHPESIPSSLPAEPEVFHDFLLAYAAGFFASTITLLIRRDVFEQVGVFVPGMKRAQDNDLWYRIAYQFPKVGYLTQSLAIYHLDTPGSSIKRNDRIEDIAQLVMRLEKLSKSQGRYEAFYPCARNILQNRIRQFLDQKRYAEIKILLKQFEQYYPERFKREIKFRLTCPIIFNPIAEAVHKIKGLFKMIARFQESRMFFC